jgi:hypothetical protein
LHHLVWGILLLLLSGYGWLRWMGRLMSMMYGVAAALTLFGGLLAVGVFGEVFFRGIAGLKART